MEKFQKVDILNYPREKSLRPLLMGGTKWIFILKYPSRRNLAPSRGGGNYNYQSGIFGSWIILI